VGGVQSVVISVIKDLSTNKSKDTLNKKARTKYVKTKRIAKKGITIAQQNEKQKRAAITCSRKRNECI